MKHKAIGTIVYVVASALGALVCYGPMFIVHGLPEDGQRTLGAMLLTAGYLLLYVMVMRCRLRIGSMAEELKSLKQMKSMEKKDRERPLP